VTQPVGRYSTRIRAALLRNQIEPSVVHAFLPSTRFIREPITDETFNPTQFQIEREGERGRGEREKRLNPPRPPIPIRQPKHDQPVRRQHAQAQRHGLSPCLDGARHGAAAQHGRRQQADLLAVGLPRLQAVQAEQVERADGEARRDGGDGARARVADDAAGGGEEGEGAGGEGGELLRGLYPLLYVS